MKAAVLLAACTLACIGFVASGATAGSLTIRIETSAEIRDGELVVAVEVSNSGDEAALAVTPVLRFRGQAVRGTRRTSLEPGGALEQTLAVPAVGLGAGRWPFQLGLSYTDANQVPFEALHVGTVELEGTPSPRVAVGSFEAGSLSDTGELEVHVKNLSDALLSVRLGVLAPGALEVRGPADAIVLAAREERPLTLRITNRAALAGSRYPVFVALEYDDGSVHQTVIARSEVTVLGEEAPFGPVGRPRWIGVAIFGLLFLGLLLFRLARR